MPPQSTPCACLCGALAKPGRQYLLGHNRRGLGPSRQPVPQAQRFWHYVVQTENCWIWVGSQSKAGYGTFCLGPRGVGYGLAHRVAYSLLVGPIPPGLVLDHLCRVRACVNPAHLEPVTPRENVLRGVNANVKLHLAGVCANGHEATDDNVYRRKATSRIVHCRPCRNQRRREAYQRAKVSAASDTSG